MRYILFSVGVFPAVELRTLHLPVASSYTVPSRVIAVMASLYPTLKICNATGSGTVLFSLYSLIV